MKTRLPLEEKCDLLKNELDGSLQRKHALELQINQQFEELKRLQISMEKCSRTMTTGKKD